MANVFKNIINTLKGGGEFSDSSDAAVMKSATSSCPPPGATNVKTFFGFCVYKDAQGNTGWCMLR